MKKVLLVVTALLLVGTAVFAADIAGDKLALKATVSGSAKLIWGMSFDDQSAAETGIQYASGFQNVVDGSVTLTLISKHTVQNSGSGPVYAEIQIADIGMIIAAGSNADTYETILSKITAKLNIGPVYVNILGVSHSLDMAFFGQKLVSGREDKRGIYNKLDEKDGQNDQKGRYKGLSIGLTDQRMVIAEIGVSSAGTWAASSNGVSNELLARAPIVYIATQGTAGTTKVPLGKVYVPVSGGANVYFDGTPTAGAAYYVLDSDEYYSTTATAANSQHVYNIYVMLGLGTDITEATGITLNVKGAMTSYLAAANMAGFTNRQSGIGGALGYKLSTSGLIKGSSLQAGVGVDWRNTAPDPYVGTGSETAINGWTPPAGQISGSKDELTIAGGLRFNLPGNAMYESGSAEYWGIAKAEKLNIYPGFAIGFQNWTGKNATSSGAWRPAITSYGVSFFDGTLIPVVDVVAIWNTQWDTANINAAGTRAGIWELGLRLGAAVDIFTPYVEYYHWQDNAYMNAAGGVNVYNEAFSDAKDAYYDVDTLYNGGAYTTLKVGVDIAPFKLTTFGIAYESGNLALVHDQYNVGTAPTAGLDNVSNLPMWGTLQINVKIAL